MKLMIEPKADGNKEAMVVADDYQMSLADQAARCYLLSLPPEYAGKRHSEVLAAWRSGVIPDPLSAAGAPPSDFNAAYVVQVYVSHAAGLTRVFMRYSTAARMDTAVTSLRSAIIEGKPVFDCVDDIGAVRIFVPTHVRLVEGFHIPSFLVSEKAVQDMQAQLTPARQ